MTAPILEREFSETLDRFLMVCDVVRLDTDEIPVSRIQEDYVAKRPPFGGSNPKAQFPDGFAIAAMRDWLEEDGEGESIAVITEEFLVELHFRGVDPDSIELARVQVEGDVGLSVEDGSQDGD